MARRRKTGLTQKEWQNVFKQAAEYCKAHRGGLKQQECMSRVLREYEAKLAGAAVPVV